MHVRINMFIDEAHLLAVEVVGESVHGEHRVEAKGTGYETETRIQQHLLRVSEWAYEFCIC